MIELKSAIELDRMRAAGALAARTLEYAISLVKPGVSTGRINKLTDIFIREHQAIPAPLNYRGFPKSICTSVNNVVCHGIPSDKEILKEGDIVGIDVTVILKGFHGDTCSTVPVGQISKEARRLLSTALEGQQEAIKAVAPGKPLGVIGEKIQKVVYAQNYGVVEEFLGHGLGREFHEDPVINHVAHSQTGNMVRGNKIRMKEGMTFTIEPMINQGTWRTEVLSDGWTAVTMDKQLSAQYEHSLAVTADGYEILTLLPESPNTFPGGFDPRNELQSDSARLRNENK